jgi:hypothetical protein
VKYIITGAKPGPYGTEQRPTLDSFKGFGPGEYEIRRADGSISKHVSVSVNRNGNFRVVATNAEGLDAISTVVLQRMVRAYAPIVKAWPKSASAKDYKKVIDEVQARAVLVGTVSTATPKPKLVHPELDDGEMEASERAALVVVS